jgi:hypothetical protein
MSEPEISRTGTRNLGRGQFRDEVIANSIRGGGGRCLPIQTEREHPAETRREGPPVVAVQNEKRWARMRFNLVGIEV